MSFNRVAIAAVLLCGVSLSACQSAQQALGLAKVTPDEFRVVSKAPLVVPPEFALRPPSPGEPRPQELQPESQARNALLGARAAEDRSEGEKLLATRAGGDKADPLIRYVVDDEFGAIAHKEPSFADRVMFWKKEDKVAAPLANTPAASTPAPIDPSIEAQRIKKLTDGKAIVISRTYDGHTKLPGL